MARRDEALAFVSRRISETGVCPTYSEIGTALNVSRARASQYITDLVKRGEIERVPGSQRNLRIVHKPRDQVLSPATLWLLGLLPTMPELTYLDQGHEPE